MIYIDRSGMPPPAILQSKGAERERQRAKEFFFGKSRFRQIGYRFQPQYYTQSGVKSALRELFNNKCAYCESHLLAISGMNVDHFRPMQKAMHLNGNVDEDHYWWLAYEWSNLYASCQVCNASKRTRFPVTGKRLNFARGISSEKALLLDPCKKADFKTQHFGFTENGEIVGLTKRGEITIEIFNLNRKDLVSERMSEISQLNLLLQQARQEKDQEVVKRILDQVSDLVNPKGQHSLAKQFFLNKYKNENSGVKKFEPLVTLIDLILDNITISVGGIAINTVLKKAAPFIKQLHSSYSIDLESTDEKKSYFASAKRIRSIEIENFKVIKHLKLDYPEPIDNVESWLVLLGENGSGKSTVLQAVALTLAGSKNANLLGLDASTFVNQNSRKGVGFVKIVLEGMDDSIELHFSSSSKKFSSNFPEPKVILMAFGSTRLMATNKEEIKDSIPNLRNLFDPYTPLPNAERWIADPVQVKTSQFDKIAIELKRMLQLPEEKLIYRRKTDSKEYELFIKLNPGKKGIRLRDLSAGYQVILVLTINIIREVLKTWKEFQLAEGIVIIDEIGVHLHPRWKMQIIRTLRDIFPAMTFIVTTHEPLCLRGVNKGEVALMKYSEDGEVIALTDLPSPNSLTVDQLITSKFFGLITSFDPEVELKLNSYYALKAKLELSADERTQLNELEHNLKESDIIDDSEAPIKKRTVDIGWVSSPTQQEELKNKIKSLWEDV